MRFTVVEIGYDQWQVDAHLADLGIRAARLAARLEGLGSGRDWDLVRGEAAGLCDLVGRPPLAAAPYSVALAGPAPSTSSAPPARSRGTTATEREAAQILARARAELDAARAEARRVRERAYAEAVAARRKVEEALRARDRRATRLAELLDGLPVERVPAETATAAAARPTEGRQAARPVDGRRVAR
ncbi:hypothetical protein GA0070616_5275 [Micromonospora nigra]|uniref:Uncharacterized protein n=1 Tax=Micromonospora nigra TaxID=145857 RepID=A0A1C6T208_9ACTN|nr:hypothetical protein [Micromonospora nigra]SCL35622.1 hypothetical protein GA0070616_5275 [Micromonospora nigra]